jgi:hypothetical protein
MEPLLPLLLLLVAVAGIALLVWWLTSTRRGEVSPEEASAQEVRENLDGQIMAMLHQTGGAMPQSHIRVALGLPTDEVAVALRRLEEQGRILRAWQPNEYTFSVRTA